MDRGGVGAEEEEEEAIRKRAIQEVDKIIAWLKVFEKESGIREEWTRKK